MTTKSEATSESGVLGVFKRWSFIVGINHLRSQNTNATTPCSTSRGCASRSVCLYMICVARCFIVSDLLHVIGYAKRQTTTSRSKTWAMISFLLCLLSNIKAACRHIDSAMLARTAAPREVINHETEVSSNRGVGKRYRCSQNAVIVVSSSK